MMLVQPCALGVLLELHEKDSMGTMLPDIPDGTSHLSQYILSLFANSKDFYLKFKVQQLGLDSNGSELNGRTAPINSYKGWEITLDSDLVNNGTRLYIAKTVIHEVMHAYINYIMKTDRTSTLYSDLQTIYTNHYLNQSGSNNLTQHEFMSQFVDAFAQSLSVWDNHQQSIDYYKMLSWGGLETSTAYQILTNQTQIQDAIQKERYGLPGAKGEECN